MNRLVLNLKEAYDNGWQIDDLTAFIARRFEEEYEDPDPQETIRRIARSQDDRSFLDTKQYLRNRLLAMRPQRKYAPNLDSAIEAVLAEFYYGVPMSTSLAQQRKSEKERAARREAMQRTALEIQGELHGIPFEELNSFLLEVIWPKYGADYSAEEMSEVLALTVHDLLEANLLEIPSKEDIKRNFSAVKLLPVREELEKAVSEMKYIPDTTVVLEEKPRHALVDWLTNVKELRTNTLRIQQAVRANFTQTILINYKDEPQAHTVELHNNNGFPNGQHYEIVAELVGEDHVQQLADLIKKKFA